MNVASVKARLKNFASESGRTFQDALTYYGLERTIYRISVSNYADNFVLKGGIFLYATFNGNYERATNLAAFVRSLIGLSREVINQKFGEYLSGNTFNLQQQEFVKMIINYVQENGDIKKWDLVNTEPFNELNCNGIFGEYKPRDLEIVELLHSSIEVA